MRTFEGRVVEIEMFPDRCVGAWIACPPRWFPRPGQFLMGRLKNDNQEPLALPLFSAGISGGAFLAAPPLPANWQPGEEIFLRGPLGHGFRLPAKTRRIALAAFGDTIARLLPLSEQALQQNAAITIFADCPLPVLPVSLEAYPLSSLPEALSWADYLALDLPLEALSGLRRQLNLAENISLPYQAEALITTPIPCGGLAECGACAVTAHRGWKLACKDGPVFDLSEIEW